MKEIVTIHCGMGPHTGATPAGTVTGIDCTERGLRKGFLSGDPSCPAGGGEGWAGAANRGQNRRGWGDQEESKVPLGGDTLVRGQGLVLRCVHELSDEDKGWEGACLRKSKHEQVFKNKPQVKYYACISLLLFFKHSSSPDLN